MRTKYCVRMCVKYRFFFASATLRSIVDTCGFLVRRRNIFIVVAIVRLLGDIDEVFEQKNMCNF